MDTRLEEEDLYHCHKVMTSDIGECNVFLGMNPDEETRQRYLKRIKDDERVIRRIERTLGLTLTWS